MGEMSITVNGKQHTLEVEPETPLLWVLRDSLGLTGTKFSCGIAECGACTVHIDGEAVRSCVIPVSSVVDSQIVTIEGLSERGITSIQEAWIEEDVAQCGYCQPGQIMSAAALLANQPKPTEGQINEAMSGNLCRCGTYPRIVRAIKRLANEKSAK
jgi:aerobic-type carbon monoxide dehydrogenase small subunit (CoxS/CutS family)